MSSAMFSGVVAKRAARRAVISWTVAVALHSPMMASAMSSSTTTRSGAAAPADPWDGRTLEWTIPSPPPVYNFATVPVVHDRDDFWAQKYGDGHGTPPRKGAAGPVEDPASIHMPPPSYWPILLAGAFFVMMSGILVSIYQVVAGGLLTLYCMVRFMLEYHRPPAGGHH